MEHGGGDSHRHSVACAVVALVEGRAFVLVQKRCLHLGGKLAFPSGLVRLAFLSQQRDTAGAYVAAAKQELFEEAGLDLRHESLIPWRFVPHQAAHDGVAGQRPLRYHSDVYFVLRCQSRLPVCGGPQEGYEWEMGPLSPDAEGLPKDSVRCDRQEGYLGTHSLVGRVVVGSIPGRANVLATW